MLNATTTPPLADLQQGTGLGCLPDGIVGQDLTLNNKLNVLNCLVFATPHSFWVKGSGTREAEALKEAIIDGNFAWLDRGDWECTKSPDGPIPSCLKHDVAYGGLQEFAGSDLANPTDPLMATSWMRRGILATSRWLITSSGQILRSEGARIQLPSPGYSIYVLNHTSERPMSS